MDKTKVIFIDDDTILGNIVMEALKIEGIEGYYQTSLAGIVSAINEIRPNMIIIDVELGNTDGINEMPKLRLAAPDIPILVVSSHTESIYTSRALESGSIAYLKKPFDVAEVIAYIKRYTDNDEAKDDFKIGSLSLGINNKILSKNGETIKELTPTEFKILEFLLFNKNRNVSKDEIMNNIWKDNNHSDASLNNFISKLRKYLSHDKQIQLKSNNNKGVMLMTKE